MHLLVTLLGFFTDQNDRFLYPLIYFKYWNPHPYIYPKPEKKKNVPLSHGASPYRPWQGVSLPRIDKSPSAVLFVHYSFVFSPKYSILMLHCFHLKFLLISYRSCCYGLNGWLRLFGRSCRFICRHGATSAAAVKSGLGCYTASAIVMVLPQPLLVPLVNWVWVE